MTQYVETAFVPRPTCYRCFRPESLCYCEDLGLVDNRTRVVVVQHPREQFHPLNTARIAEYGLKSSLVIRKRPSQLSAALEQAALSPEAAILFPSRDAEELESLVPERRPPEIIVIDGTWSQAKTLLRDVPALSKFRKLRFTPPEPSSYRIRKEPRLDYLSTIESIAYVLRQLEPETPGLETLQQTFSAMIDRNIAARRPSAGQRRYQRRNRRVPHRFPEALLESTPRFVSVYCEGTSRFAVRDALREGAASSGVTKEPLVVYLKRWGSSAQKRILLVTERTPPARLLQHLCLSEAELSNEGRTLEEAKAELEDFIHPGETPVVWNASSLSILREIGLDLPKSLILKGACCDFLTYLARDKEEQAAAGREGARGWGGMEDFLAHLEIRLSEPQEEGRGPERLSQTEALLSWIIAEAEKHCRAFVD